MMTATKLTVASVIIAGTVGVHAQSATSQGGRVTNSTSTVRAESTQITTVSGEAGASILARGVYGRVGGGRVTLGGLRACNGGTIDNVHTDVRLQGVTITSTGETSIGEVSAGCTQ